MDACWTGCLRLVDGIPVIYYTGVTGQHADRCEEVCIARRSPDLDSWTKGPGALIEGPPPQLAKPGYHRDPFLWHDAKGWHMIVGSGLEEPETRGVIGVYHSDDAFLWRWGGLFLDGATIHSEVEFGDQWECPQLVQLGDSYALIVSV